MGSFKKRDLSYRVVFSGSSMIGTMEGSASWSRTERYLAGKLSQEKIKCFRWWCKACEEFPLIFVEDIAEHVIKIPFPSVIKLMQDEKVDWAWQDPDSEWAQSNGTATESFEKLVANKSRPSWVVAISKEKVFA